MNPSNLHKLLSQAEGLKLEFKRAKNQIPTSLFETVSAFLNRNGGEIVLGVNDDGTLEGIDENRVYTMTKEIANLSCNPQKLFPTFMLEPQIVEFESKKLIYIFVPTSSQVHKTANKIYDRAVDGDFLVTNDSLIKQIYLRKSAEYSENKIFPYLTVTDFEEGVTNRVRKIIRINRPDHPWNELTDDEFFKVSGLYRTDFSTGLEGFTLAALLLFGKSQSISSMLPHYKIDALVRKQNIERYDDRINIRENLVEAYDILLGFAQKHLPDKFYLDGTQRISLRDKIFREIIANMLIHREYNNPFPSTFIIYSDKVETKNANKPHNWGQLKPGNFAPFPKNPHIAQIFTQMGRSEELGTGIVNVFKFNKLYSKSEQNSFLEDDVFVSSVPLNANSEIDFPDGLNGGLNGELNGELSDRQKKVLKLIQNTPGIQAVLISKETDIPFSTVDKIIRKFLAQNIIERRGSKKTGGYFLK